MNTLRIFGVTSIIVITVFTASYSVAIWAVGLAGL